MTATYRRPAVAIGPIPLANDTRTPVVFRPIPTPVDTRPPGTFDPNLTYGGTPAADPVTGTIDPNMTWVHPAYSGSDPAYQAWLAGAELQGTDAISQAKLRRAQLAEQERQAMFTLDHQAVTGRRTVQNNMLSRGMFRSGETDRRKQEFDAQIEQGRANANSAYQDQLGTVDQTQRTALANIGTQAATQVSQAMLRDALAKYQADQLLAAPPTPAPAQQQAAPPAATQVAPVDSSYADAANAYAAALQRNQQAAMQAGTPITNSASLSNRSSAKPAVKAPPTLLRRGLQ